MSEGRLDPGRARRIAAALSQRSLPCPARRLELVVMTRAAAAGEPGEPAFELNLNTGKGEEDHAGVDPAAEPAHWFLVDRSIARARGRSLHGPAPREVLAGVARAQMLDALRRSLDWHEAHRPRSPDSVLNACRAWRWARTGHWTAKASAADWACGRMSDPAVVRAALAARAAGRRLPARDVSSFLDAVNSALGAARG